MNEVILLALALFSSCPTTDTKFDSIVCSDLNIQSKLGKLTEYRQKIEASNENQDILAEALLKERNAKTKCDNLECITQWVDEQTEILQPIAENASTKTTELHNDTSTQTKEYQAIASSNSNINPAETNELKDSVDTSKAVFTKETIPNAPRQLTPYEIRRALLVYFALLALIVLVIYIRDKSRSKTNPDYFSNTTKIGYVFATAALLTIAFGAIFTQFALSCSLIGIIPFLVMAYGEYKSCPKCHKSWARVHTDSEELEHWTETKTVNRQDHTKDRNGRIIATHHRKEQVLVDCRKIKETYGCKYCGNVWHAIKTHKN